MDSGTSHGLGGPQGRDGGGKDSGVMAFAHEADDAADDDGAEQEGGDDGFPTGHWGTLAMIAGNRKRARGLTARGQPGSLRA
ncbi:MAG: hypothetical protein DVB22_001097 [Verrucomicrobia bacterium]|nr:MAG: hypothetical protein DVB22_001097 [Verrucomicrobiota bacterium]